MTFAEAALRAMLGGSALHALATRLAEDTRARGASVRVGEPDSLHGAIIERIARGGGAFWQITEEGHELLVQTDAPASWLAETRIAHRALPADEALARLRAAPRVALLPVDVEERGAHTQLRVFFFPSVIPRRVDHADPRLAEHVPLDIAIVRAFTSLPARTLCTVRVGDAITLDRCLPDGRFLGRLAGRAQDLALGLEDVGLVFEGLVARDAPQLTPQENAMQDPESDVPLEPFTNVEVELTLDVGQVRLTLAELAGLRVGAVLATGVKSADRVTLRANGRAVGLGTLVRIEGELAVRIDALASGAREAQ